MANGAPIVAGNSSLLLGPLGVVKLFFDGWDLGKTTADSEIMPNQAIKEITYQQDGTMPADTVRTGIQFQVKATFGEINTKLLSLLMSGFLDPVGDPNNDSAIFDRSMYQSMRTLEAGPLRIAAVDSNGVASELDEDVTNIYEAVPMIDGTLINWGADSQRELPVTFNVYWHEFSEGESTARDGAFGYYGDPTDLDVPAVVWPDRFGPQLSTANASSATAVKLTFDEDLTLVAGKVLTETIVVKVNEEFIVPTGAVIGTDPDDDEIDLTLPAASIAAGDDVEIYIGAGCVEDGESTPNQNAVIDGFVATNSVV
jgi:hypothetical protein